MREITEKNTWSREGTYTIRAKARDIHGLESEWTTLEINMPRNKQLDKPLFQRILEQLIQRFPLFAKLLQIPVFNRLLNL